MKFIVILISILVSQNLKAANTCGEVIQVSGKVEVLRAQTGEDLNRVGIRVEAPYSLLCTDILVTLSGSRAKVKLVNGMVTLSPNSRISIAKVIKGSQTPSLLNLTYGKIRTFFEGKKNDKGANQTQFRVKTPTAVVGVRGTDFYVDYDANKELTTQATLKGSVEVEQIATKSKVLVEGGYQVEVSSKENLSENTAGKESELRKIEPQDVKPIGKETITQIRQTSALVNEEIDFKSKEAVAILGEPEKWIPSKNEIPGDLKDIKNEF